MKTFLHKITASINRPLLLKQLALVTLMTLISEYLYRHAITGLGTWLFSHLFLFVMNLSVAVIVLSLTNLVIRKVTVASGLVFAFGLGISFINASKYALRNVPLTLEDISLIKEVWALRDNIITGDISGDVILALILLIVLGFGLKKYYQSVSMVKKDQTHLGLLITAVLLFAIGQGIYYSNLPMETTGFFYSLTNDLRDKATTPEAVQREAYEQMYSDIDQYNSTGVSSGSLGDGSTEKPNVIVIMSEAYWDINKMGVEFTENPVPYFESLRDESYYGELYVPVVGGGTVNTEFEVMTGMTVKNYSNDFYMVYPNEIDAPFPSLASIFRKQGYESIALHPYLSWYYNRTEVYKYFGFNGFESLEVMGDTEKFGSFTKDSATFDALLNLIKKTEKPLFNYTVTIQNHGPYGDMRFTDDERFIWLKTQLSDDANYFVNNYVQGLAYSDQALEDFIEALRTLDEPTIVVFFGDHLPMLGEDFLAYRESGYIGDETTQEVLFNLDMMTVPFIVWRNDQNISEKLPTMNASYLTPKILEWAGADVPDYLKATEEMSERMPVFNYEYGIDSKGNISEDGTYPLELAFAEYDQINTNLLTLSDADQWLVTQNEAYYQYFSKVAITDVEVDESVATISGYDFSPEMTLTINNTPQTYEYVDDGTLIVSAVLASEDELQVTLADQGDEKIKKSNIYKIP